MLRSREGALIMTGDHAPSLPRPLRLYDPWMFEQISFDEKGLVPCVARDFASGEVLTLAYASEESLRLTIETGELHFYSRSREQIWRKGESSGDVLRLRQLRYDCDGDALLA